MGLFSFLKKNSIEEAIKNGDVKAVQQYISEGKDPNATNGKGLSLLMLACEAQNKTIVQLLLDNNADINFKNKKMENALVYSENLEIFEILLKNGADSNYNAKNNMTPLIAAVYARDIERINLLIDNGADVNFESNTDLYDFLKEHVNQIFAVDGKITSILMAIIMQEFDIANLLYEKGAMLSNHAFCLRWACAGKGDIRFVKILVENENADINEKVLIGQTALFSASYEGNNDIIKYLISKGADVNITDNHGCSALHDAVMGGHINTVKLLIENGSDKSIASTDEDRATPLDYARAKGFHEIAEYLGAI